MPRIGLNRDAVIDAAVQLIEEQGYRAFSMNELARRLGIKTASLYNHVKSADELIQEVRLRIAEMIRQAEFEAIEGKHGEAALAALCDGYRSFAWEHIELYKINMGRQKDRGMFIRDEEDEVVDPIFRVLSEFGLDQERKMHWHRILRAVMHGFITQEYGGSFRNFPVNKNETYRIAVQTLILGIKTDGKEQ